MGTQFENSDVSSGAEFRVAVAVTKAVAGPAVKANVKSLPKVETACVPISEAPSPFPEASQALLV
jgi:hypothetical protein